MKIKLLIAVFFTILSMKGQSQDAPPEQKKSEEQRQEKRPDAEKPNEDEIICIELDYCQDCCGNNTLKRSLRALKKLRKGDFFCLKLLNVNPYRYNIQVSTKYDTLTPGPAPQLLTEFMDVSKLGSLAASIISASGRFEPKTHNPENVEDIAALGTLILDANGSLTVSDEKIAEYFSKKNLTASQKINFKAKVSAFQEEIGSEIATQDDLIKKLQELEALYNKVSSCYHASIRGVLNTEFDCISPDSRCFKSADCNCLKEDMENTISQLIKLKSELMVWLKTEGQNADLEEELLKSITNELGDEKYTFEYLMKIYDKAYSNFMIAENISHLSTYNSMPIQVQDDNMELRIDITPKTGSSSPQGQKDTKKECQAAKCCSHNELTNNSPVNINISSAESATKKPENPNDAATKDAGKTAAGSIAKEELKLNVPAATFERHLKYKFRTVESFFSYSGGFFVDWLHDENYANKPTDPANPATTYQLVKESNQSPNKYGIMAAVHAGRYINHSDFFLQFTAGPALSLGSSLQPRLLVGAGLGWGAKGKFSLNGGLAIGQVKRLSNAFDANAVYVSQQENIYYSSIATKAFIAICYQFQ